MHEITCPHCQKAFKVDEAGYADILKQVHNQEFEVELKTRLETFEDGKKTELALVEAQVAQKYETQSAKKEIEIEKLKAEATNAEMAKKLAVQEAVSRVEKQRDEFKNDVEKVQLEKDLQAQALKEKYETQIQDRDDAIERLKDMKARLSTKMVGETLEQHCENEFNSFRAAAFPNAYFEKDNDAKSGSKGDYIFRDSAGDDIELVSIMFEMKNENDTTATKKKNEDFLKELDKDRLEKGCEYAILVSLLEPENDLYNSGIVDVSHRYPKMYVIRPQFFIPMITLLRNASQGALQFKSELALVKSQSVDITDFEENLNVFKKGFDRNYDLAAKNFQTAIKQIDDSIKLLGKMKDSLLDTEKYLRIANDKAQDVTIKKLTKGNQTMIEKFGHLGA